MQRHAGRHMTHLPDSTDLNAARVDAWITSSITAMYQRTVEATNAPPSGVRFDDIVAAIDDVVARAKAVRPRQAISPPDVRPQQAAAGVARRPRKPTLASLLKQAADAGKSVKGAEVYSDRTVLQFGEPTPVEPENPWPLDEFRPNGNKQ
jgi:hypothetical protein